MKYVIVCENPGEQAQCQGFASTEEEAANRIEQLVSAGTGVEGSISLYSLEQVPFKVEHVPTVTFGGNGQSAPAFDMGEDTTVFEGFGPSSPHEHLASEEDTSDTDHRSTDLGDLPPATTIDGEPVGEAEVFTFEA